MSEQIDEAEIERVARAMTAARGMDPDLIVPETGYSDARMIPRWMKDREWAMRHIAAHRALSPQP